MATCANCIHHSLCDYNTNISGNGKVRLVYAEGADVKCSFFQNTADVVPKSEVERLEADNEKLTINMNAYGLTAKRLAEEKAEVAREIFAEIEENLTAKEPPIVEMDYFKFLELKDKYIPKDCRDCKHMLSCEPNVFGICDEYEEEDKNGKENT